MAKLDIQDVPQKPVSDLRARVIRGGAAIAIRQCLGMALSVVSVLLVTRIIGPYQYGIFAAASGIAAFIATAATWGLDVYLLRKTGEPTSAEYNQAFTLFTATSVFFVAGLTFFRHGIARFAGLPEIASPLAIMSLFIPCNLINIPGVVRLDRALRFQRVAVIELAGQAIGCALAVPLAFHHMGCWAPILGILTGQFLGVILIYVSAPMRLRFHWERDLVKQMLGYGLGYSGAVWVWQLRALVNPLIVGRFAGAQGVGFVALAIRLVEVLSFIKQVTWRVAMAALAKLDGDTGRLRRSITEGMCLQAVAVGFPLALFAAIGPFVLPRIFGARWDPAFRLFPFLALSYLLISVFNLHTSVLALLTRNLQLMQFYAIHVALFAASAALLVPMLGYMGYGWAEVMAFAAYYLLHHYICLSIGSPDYGPALLWFVVCGIAIMIASIPAKPSVAAPLLLLVPLVSSRARASLEGYIRILLRRSSKSRFPIAAR
jgi:O-antigen/teichoic acid export membrane protein